MRSAVVLLAICGGLLYAQPKPVVRVSVKPPSGVIVGQPVVMTVDILGPNYLTGAPVFPELEIPNAIAILSDERSQNLTETIDGVSYAGIQKAYRIYPQLPGRYQVPPAEIKIKYAAEPPATVEASVPIPATAFEARVPPEAEGLDYFLPASQIRLEQRFDRPLKDLKTGDTIVRTVTVIAVKTQAMMIPPLQFEAPEGIRVYPAAPQVNDKKTDRGEFVQGERVERVSYLIRKEGSYVLPEIKLIWWDLGSSTLRQAVLPAIQISAAPNPSYVPDLAPEPEPQAVPVQPVISWRERVRQALPWGVGLLVFLAIAWFGYRFRRRIAGLFSRPAASAEQIEQTRFNHLRAACHRNDASSVYPALLDWLRAAHPGVSLDEFAHSAKVSGLEQRIAELTEQLYRLGSSAQWSGTPLLEELEKTRTKTTHDRNKVRALPGLNPAR